MTFQFAKHNGDPSLIFTDEALEQMLRYRQDAGRKEAGGQLFGLLDGQSVIITKATPPSPKDWRAIFRFKPNRKNEQAEILRQYKNGFHYVGDWHTHPQCVPIPSNTDVISIRDCFKKSQHDLKYFVLAIVGTEPLPKGLYVALVNSSDLETLYPVKSRTLTR